MKQQERAACALKRLVTVTALAAGLVACSASSPAETAGEATSPSPDDLTATVSPDPTDRALAESAVLANEDLGSGWIANPYTPGPFADEDEASLAACLRGPVSSRNETARATSPSYASGDARRALATVTFFENPALPRADLEAYEDERAAVPCLKESAQRQNDRMARPASVTVSRISPSPGGEGTVAYRYRYVNTSSDGDITLITDLVLAVKGRAEVTLVVQDFDSPVPFDVQERAVLAMLGRLP